MPSALYLQTCKYIQQGFKMEVLVRLEVDQDSNHKKCLALSFKSEVFIATIVCRLIFLVTLVNRTEGNSDISNIFKYLF